MDSTHKDPRIAALLSLIIPGAGLFYVSKPLQGLLFLAGATLGYLLFIFPGLIVHIFAVVVSYVQAQSFNSARG